MKNYVAPGEHITLTAEAAVTAGQLVKIGAVTGVAQHDAALGDPVTLVRRGVFELPKTEAQAWTAGAKVYLAAEGDVLTTTASGNTLVGVALEATVDPSAVGVVLLDGAIR
ncbi:DUF2190 family protein [Thioclava sp. GXIMD4215]|uniref:DUF2190 family protein n=1 Tax=Thioclava sp. GXIMD4215 TaxID=3131928 RepID=UPI00324D4895